MRNVRYVRHLPGLTLIELVLVVAVLAILAGFIVPRLGFIRNLAGEAGNATTIAESANQAVLYNVAIGHYPAGEDTLLDTTGAGLYSKLNSSLSGALQVLDLSTDPKAGLSIVSQISGSSNGGTVTVYNNDSGVSLPNNSGVIAASLIADKTANTASGKVAQVKIPTSPTSTAGIIYAANYPANLLNPATGAPTDGTYLVALGYGPGSEINGKTGLEAPALFTKNNAEYARPILLLKVFPTGSTAGGGIVPAGSAATTASAIGGDASTVGSNLDSTRSDQAR